MRKIALGLLFFLGTAVMAFAQVPSIPGPYNIDIGAVLTDTNNATTPRTSANQSNLAYRGVLCSLVATAGSGSVSTSFGIDAFDAATNSWKNIAGTPFLPITNPGGTGIGVSQILAINPGIATSGIATNTVSVNFILPRVWRISRTLNGTLGPAVTAKVGCNYLK